MSEVSELAAWAEVLRPQALGWLLCTARFLPAAFLVPILGGGAVSTSVRLALCLALAAFAQFEAGVAVTVPARGVDVVAAFSHEVVVGFAIGFVAALPFDAARMGGRLLDTLRGANAEAALPGSGSREAATGDMLHQLLVALVFASGAYRPLVRGLVASFVPAPAGAWGGFDGEGLVHAAVSQAGGALSAGLAVGAPAAAVSLVVDAALGVAARVAPQLDLRGTGAPAKLMLGAAGVLLCLGTVCERLTTEVGTAADFAQALASAVFGRIE